jgi:hypothetical protein
MRRLASILLGLAACALTNVARADDIDWLPVVRVAAGPAIHFAPASERTPFFALDVTAGMAAGVSDWHVGDYAFVFNPELGYSYDAIGLNAFNATFGVGLGNAMIAVAYHPRFIAGRAAGETAVGMRNGLALHAVFDTLSLELGHQFVHYGDAYHHDVRILLGVNPAPFFKLLFWASSKANAISR